MAKRGLKSRPSDVLLNIVASRQSGVFELVMEVKGRFAKISQSQRRPLIDAKLGRWCKDHMR